jgi:uncharacterized protein (TIGR02246 family)
MKIMNSKNPLLGSKASGSKNEENDQDHKAEQVGRSVQTIQAAFNRGDADTLRGLMSEDHVSTLTYARLSNAAELLKALSAFKFSEYKISELKVKVFTTDVALASHQATIKGTYKGRAVPSPVQVTTVWVERSGTWLQASYQETPLARPGLDPTVVLNERPGNT